MALEEEPLAVAAVFLSKTAHRQYNTVHLHFQSMIYNQTHQTNLVGSTSLQKYYFMKYVPKYHQKLGCQANGGGRAPGGPPPP